MHTLKEKITLLYLLLVLITAIVGITAAINLYNLSDSIDGLMIKNYKSISICEKMQKTVDEQNNFLLQSIINKTPETQKDFDKYTADFLSLYDSEVANITELGERESVDELEKLYAFYIESSSNLIASSNKNDYKLSIAGYTNQIKPAFTKIRNQISAISIINEKAMFYGKDKVKEQTKKALSLIIYLSIALVASGIFISRYSTNKYLTPITKLTQTMKQIKAGEMHHFSTIESNDEIGELAKEFNNMTERLEAYEQSTLGTIMVERNKSYAIIKNIAEPIAVLNSDTNFLLINKAFEKAFHVSETETLGRYFRSIINHQEINSFILAATKAVDSHNQKIFAVIQNGDEYFYNIIVESITDSEASLYGIIVLFQNVTALKELEAIRNDFIATISHEFKTPLTSIIIGADILSEENVGPLNIDQKEIVATIKEDSDSLSKLVNDLLVLIKIESGKSAFTFHYYGIDNIIESAVKTFYVLAEQKNVNLYFDIPEALPDVYADFDKIVWVLNNLISNSLKYTNAGDEISISAFMRDSMIHVTVKDTGVGIPAEYTEKIFEKFVQVKDGDMEIRGTGLGLAVVKEIVKAHGGNIWCESELDEGSRFTFTLKIVDEESEKA